MTSSSCCREGSEGLRSNDGSFCQARGEGDALVELGIMVASEVGVIVVLSAACRQAGDGGSSSGACRSAWQVTIVLSVASREAGDGGSSSGACRSAWHVIVVLSVACREAGDGGSSSGACRSAWKVASGSRRAPKGIKELCENDISAASSLRSMASGTR